jgi:hypothetical protein
LNAERRGDDLLLSWNPELPAVTSAITRMLLIEAGSDQRNLVLGPEELRSGRLIYTPAAGQVNIRLHEREANSSSESDFGRGVANESKFSASCKGKSVEIFFTFRLEGEAEASPPVFCEVSTAKSLRDYFGSTKSKRQLTRVGNLVCGRESGYQNVNWISRNRPR